MQKKYYQILTGKKIVLIFFVLISVPAPAQVDDTISGIFAEKKFFIADTLKLRQLPDSAISKMKEDKDFWYANTVFNKRKVKKNPGTNSNHISLEEQMWFQTLLWVIVIGGFAAFIMIYLANSNISLFRRKSKYITGISGGELATDDIFTINYQNEIEKAVLHNNYRVAVRLLFLQLLKRLSEKNLIQYTHEKTNLDYLMQLSPTIYYQDFFRITRNYEYSWYGQFNINPEKFDVIKNDFEKLEQRIG